MSAKNAITSIAQILFQPVPTFRHSLYFFFAALIFIPALAIAQSQPIDLDTGWQYRWGDSSFTQDGIPEWSNAATDDNGEWIDIDFPSNPPDRNSRKNVWYRTTLPANVWRDPVIYIFSVDFITEVYIDGKKIYHYGTFDKNGQGWFEGWPWHMISLPADFAGKSIYFRIFSSAPDIGLWGEIKLMERLNLIKYVITNSLKDLIVSSLSLVISLLAVIFACFQSDRKTYLLISFFTFASGLMLFAQSQAKQLLLNSPLLWEHLAAGAYFVLPVAMAMLIESWYRWRFNKGIHAIWIFHALFAATAIAASVAGWVELSSLYAIFDVLLTITLIILFIIVLMQFNQVQRNVKVMVVAFAIFSLFLLIDMGVAHNILPWTRMPIALGLLLFSLTLIAVSLHHFSVVQQELQDLNASLERKVEERTIELKQLASIDSMTGLINRRTFYIEAERIANSAKRYNHKISILVLDIDHFKQFNDTFGHAVGDAVIIAVANCINQVCRELDLPARFGGEEFVILLNETSVNGALCFAERLRQSISKIVIPNINKTVTASIGVSHLDASIENLDKAILRADKAMYLAKRKGRNKCQVG